MAPTLVIGVRRQFFRARSTTPSGQARGLENLDSDPNNQLPPEGAPFSLGRPVGKTDPYWLRLTFSHPDNTALGLKAGNGELFHVKHLN